MCVHGIYAFWSRPKHTQHHIDYQNYTRQQTTTNDYCRLQTFVQRVGLDRWFFFAAEILNNIAMETPEFISGIPTDKHASAQRRTIIKTEYIKLIENLSFL
jgi:hypothetical protein